MNKKGEALGSAWSGGHKHGRETSFTEGSQRFMETNAHSISEAVRSNDRKLWKPLSDCSF